MSVSVETFASLSEASSAIRDGAQYLGGGTIVVANANYGAQDFTRIVRTTDASLRVIRNEGNELRIGAGATMTQVMQSAEAGFLAPAARSVAGPAVRNMATVGGNLFARPPFGDFGVALLALNARIAMSDGQVLAGGGFLCPARNAQGAGFVNHGAPSRPARLPLSQGRANQTERRVHSLHRRSFAGRRPHKRRQNCIRRNGAYPLAREELRGGAGRCPPRS